MLGLRAMALTPALRMGSANETWRVGSLRVMSSFSPVESIRGIVYRRDVAMSCCRLRRWTTVVKKSVSASSEKPI
jgi:hypothetical protein